MPKLSQARGKILLFRRFWSKYRPLGIDMSGWKNNQTFQIKNNENFLSSSNKILFKENNLLPVLKSNDTSNQILAGSNKDNMNPSSETDVSTLPVKNLLSNSRNHDSGILKFFKYLQKKHADNKVYNFVIRVFFNLFPNLLFLIPLQF